MEQVFRSLNISVPNTTEMTHRPPKKKRVPICIPTEKSPLILIGDILSNDLISEIIFSSLSPAALLRFARTCRAAHTAAHIYMPRAFSIDRLLSRYFSDVLAFRNLQARTGTLLSGSTAVQFFDRSFYPESDLDLYVHMCWRREVGDWLLTQGYRFVPNTKQVADWEAAVADRAILTRDNLYTMRGVATVFTFEKRVSGEPEKSLKVQLIIASHTPIEIILCFHSTCVMNVISYENAYALYPRATFELRRALVCATDGPRQEPAIEKYATRGWEMVYSLMESNAAFRFGPRWIGDGESWTIPLDVAGIAPPPAPTADSLPLPHDPVSVTTWKLEYDHGGYMTFDLTRFEVLKYTYLLGDKELRYVMYGLMWTRQQNREISGNWSTCFDASFIKLCLSHIEEQRQVGLRP